KVTTTSYGMSDKYSLAGNVITQSYRSTGEVSKYRVRVYETKYNKDPWESKMGVLSVTDPSRGTIVFRNSVHQVRNRRARRGRDIRFAHLGLLPKFHSVILCWAHA